MYLLRNYYYKRYEERIRERRGSAETGQMRLGTTYAKNVPFVKPDPTRVSRAVAGKSAKIRLWDLNPRVLNPNVPPVIKFI